MLPALALPALGGLTAKLGTALTALKAGKGVSMAAKAGMGAYKGLKSVGLPKAAARFAGQRVNKIGRGLMSPEGFAMNYGRPVTQDLGMALAPDLLFGGLTAAMTPGDVGDKLIAGAGTALGGAAGGVAARGVFGPKSGLGILTAELGGGMLGDMAGMGVSDTLLRAKGGGMTPYEKQAAEGDAAYRKQIEDQIKAQYGIS